jgi:hypothetical protein
MRTDVSFWTVLLGLGTAAALNLISGCASSSGARPMTQAEGRIRYPIQIAVWPRGISSADENAEMDACWAGTQDPPTRADDQRFLDCMGAKGFRMRIYRQGYTLSNIGQPLPSVSTPAPSVAVPYVAPVPDQNAAPATSSHFTITWTEILKDFYDLRKATKKAKTECAGHTDYQACFTRNVAGAMTGDALSGICSNRGYFRDQMTLHNHSNYIPEFDAAASVACSW